MSKNPKIPDTWGIPDDQAKQVRDAFSKKSIRPEDAVQKALEELARDIAIIEPDSVDWGWWISYLLKQMEEEANNNKSIAAFHVMLHDLRERLFHWITDGKW